MIQKDIEDIYELAPLQQGLLFHTLLSPESGQYCEQVSCTVGGDFNVEAWKQAWHLVVDRHPVLRTSMHWEDLEKPVQVVHQHAELPIAEEDWTTREPSEQQLAAFLSADRLRGFDLAHPPLMRLALLRSAARQYHFVWSHHHLILDGWSVQLLLKEVFTYYEALSRELPTSLSALLPSPRPYRDYSSWLQRQDLTAAEQFWRAYLQGFSAPTGIGGLPLKTGEAPSADDARHLEERATLSAEETARLQAFARRHQLTLNTLVQGALALLLSRYSGVTDVVFGATVSGRSPSLAGVEQMLGLFINALPVRVKISSDQVGVWLRALQEQQVEARQYEYSPLMEVQRWSELERGQTLFDSLLVFENYPVGELQQFHSAPQFDDVRSYEQTNYPLTVAAWGGRELGMRFSCYHSQFDREKIQRMINHFKMLLNEIVVDPARSLSTIPRLPEDEYRLLVEWNETSLHWPEKACLHELIESQAERVPDNVAVVLDDDALTYAELNARANQLAWYLRSIGVGPEVIVGVMMERSLEMVVGLLAILKAGGAYAPLDPQLPAGRLAFMLEDARMPVLITQQRLSSGLPPNQTRVICAETDWPRVAEASTANPPSHMTAQNASYLIYTSGSTGQPKGALNTHGAIRNRLLWMQKAYQLTPTDCVLQKTPFSFDVSVWEFFWPLMVGARLVLARPGGHLDNAYLMRLIVQEQITTLHFVPSMLRLFLEEPGIEGCDSLRQVMSSGEALSSDLQQHFFTRLPRASLHNLYGPTEAAIDVTAWECQPADHRRIVPIGRPIANTQIYVLDQKLQLLPVGVAGELHIGGESLARGYHRRTALTAEKFVADPFASHPGQRLYRTGDLARFLDDGSIEYLGRIDQQVKIRGFRIELGEVEAALACHPAVLECAVLAREDKPGDQRLVAYLTARDESSLQIEQLREFLSATLPDYMIPSTFVQLDALPLTPNGKLDRHSLPAPDNSRPEMHAIYVVPRTTAEETIAAIWSSVLRVDRVGVYDNFFDLGGHSLLAMQLISRVRSTFQAEKLPLRSLFDAPTVEGMVHALAQVWGSMEIVEEYARTLSELEQFSEAEIEAMLTEPEAVG